MLTLAMATNYNTVTEMYLNWVFVLRHDMADLLELSETRSAQTSGICSCLFNQMVALLFSWRQAENWLWGFQLVFFMGVLAVVSGAASTRAKSRRP